MEEALTTRERKAARWGLLDAARPITTVKRLRECRRATLTGTGNPVLRTTGGGKAGYAGLATCGSVWACPCCSGKIAARRASELAAVMQAVHDTGGVVDFVTYTVRHHKGHRLRDVWDAVSKAWEAVTSGEAWMADKVGMLGWSRVVEVTHGRAGWHVHIHVIFAWSSPVSEQHSAQVAMRGWRRWDRALRRKGFDSTPVRGVKTERVVGGDTGLAGYFGKAALELTSSWSKQAKGGGRAPFAILADATADYRADDVELWREYEQASWNRRQLTWSNGRMDLRRFAGLGREASDEEVAAEEDDGRDAIALVGDSWQRISRAGQQAELLSETDEHGIAGAVAWLDARGLGWSPARPGPRRERREGLSPDQVRQARQVLDGSDLGTNRSRG